MKNILYLFQIFTFIISYKCANLPQIINSNGPYQPNWPSLDSRPLPQWYDEAKIGIFIHWGVFSVPSFHSEWFWHEWKENSSDIVNFMKKNYLKDFTYQEFAKEFTAEFFNATQWAQLFKSSGARYVVLTSKHHEGFTLWPSKYSFSWNSKDIGPHKDLIDEISKAVRKQGLIFGLYHSLYEWFNPLYLSDKSSNFTQNKFVVDKCIPEMIELIDSYKPEVLWSDGDWEAPDNYWKSKEFLAWLYNESPVKETIVTNDRWGFNTSCKHGDFYSCADRFNPGVIQPHKWENAMTLDKKSWGFRRNAPLGDYLTIEELLATLAQTISCGGNILINVGPTKEGMISPIFQERLLQLGEWLSLNGEAIYKSTSWKYQNDTFTPGVWYTKKDTSVYAIVLSWPKNNVLQLKYVSSILSQNKVVTILGNTKKLKWSVDMKTNISNINFPDKAIIKSKWAWVIKIN